MTPDSTQKLGLALARSDWPTAERILRRAAKAKRPDPSVLYNLGKVLIEMAQPDKAVVWLKRCVATAPAKSEGWFELGRAATLASQLPLAQEGFARALALTPQDSDARRNLGRVALRLGDWTTAAEAWGPLAGDTEADVALYRIAAETRAPEAATLRRALLADPARRPEALKALTRTSKGALPLSL